MFVFLHALDVAVANAFAFALNPQYTASGTKLALTNLKSLLLLILVSKLRCCDFENQDALMEIFVFEGDC